MARVSVTKIRNFSENAVNAKIHIRTATPADADTIVVFNAQLAEESEGKTLAPRTLRQGVRAVLQDPRKGRYYLACEGNQVL